MFKSYQKNVKQQRFLVLQDGTAWKVEELGWRRVYTGQYSARHSHFFPSDITRPSKFDGLQDIRMGIFDGTKEKVWWSIDPGNSGYHGKIGTFVESSKENQTRKLQYMVLVSGRCAAKRWRKYAFRYQDEFMLHTVPSVPDKEMESFFDGFPLHSDLQGETFYDKKLGSLCICVYEVFNYLEKRGAIFRPLTLPSNKHYYFLSCEEIESRIEDPDSHLTECDLRLQERREKKKSKFQAIKKRKKKLAKAIRRSHDAKMQRNFDF